MKDVESRVLSRRLGSEERLDVERLKQTLPRVLLGTKSSGIGGLRAVLLEGWADGVASPSPQTAALEEPREEAVVVEFDLPAFAGTVKAAGRDCPSGRFGDNKVFINHVWRRLHDEPSFPVKTLAAFKERLIEANSAGLLTLSRADLIQLLDPSDVRESLTPYLNGEFHFLLVEREQP